MRFCFTAVPRTKKKNIVRIMGCKYSFIGASTNVNDLTVTFSGLCSNVFFLLFRPWVAAVADSASKFFYWRCLIGDFRLEAINRSVWKLRYGTKPISKKLFLKYRSLRLKIDKGI